MLDAAAIAAIERSSIASNSSAVCCTVSPSQARVGPSPTKRTKVFEKMEQAGIARLGDAGWVKTFVGVQTSADDIFFIKLDPERSTDAMVRFKDLNGVEREVERAILRPAVRDRKFEPYGRDPIPDAYAIFPSDVQPPPPGRVRGKADIYDETTMKALFPKALDYLTAHKASLQSRSVKPDPGDTFWAYGRRQSLANLDDPKLVVRVLSLAPQYMLDTEGLVAPSGGDGGPYCLVRPDAACPYSINAVQAILSHPSVDAFVASRGRLFRGSYVVHRKTFMDPVPVPDLDTTAEHEIEVAVIQMQGIVVQLRTEQDAAIRTTLTGRFEVLRTKVNDVISAAYELSEDNMAAIVGD